VPNFSVYGLCVESDVPIPGLFPAPPDLSADVHVWLKTHSPRITQLAALPRAELYVSPGLSAGAEPILRVWTLGDREGFRFRYADGVEFVLDSAGSEVGVSWPAEMTLEDAATYLVGPILSFVLRLRGRVSLHASAVAIRGAAAVFMGPPGSGKSTMAAAFARKSFPVLTDDVVALAERDGKFSVQPGYPRVNLWADSATALFGSPEHLPLITRNWDKRFVDLRADAGGFQSSPLPVGGVYILSGAAETPGMPRIEPVPGREALMALVANTSVNYMLDHAMRSREFEFIGRLISRVPVRRAISSKLEDVDSLATAILSSWTGAGTP
jgi:hypothetical protein